jgi:hypothetical protein
MPANISLIASSVSIICMIVVIVIFARDSARPRPRIAITLLCLGMLAQGITGLLKIAGSDADFARGIFVGVCVSALLVSVMLPRRST